MSQRSPALLDICDFLLALTQLRIFHGQWLWPSTGTMPRMVHTSCLVCTALEVGSGDGPDECTAILPSLVLGLKASAMRHACAPWACLLQHLFVLCSTFMTLSRPLS